MRVLLVDDHPVVRAGLRAVLETSGLEVVAEAADGTEALELAAHTRPDVVLCDLRLGEGMSGIDVTRALTEEAGGPAVVILTTYDRDSELLGAIDAGALGYVLKDEPPDQIIEAIRSAAAGRVYLSPEHTTRVMAGMRSSRPRLTPREQEVLALVATGATNGDIADALFVSEATVKTHLVHVFEKLGVASRGQAVHAGRQAGLID